MLSTATVLPYAGFQFRGFHLNRQSPDEARFQPLFEPVDFSRVAITRQHHLVSTFEQTVEDVKEFFLRTKLLGKKLNVVDQQHVDRPVIHHEFLHGAFLQCTHHVLDKPL